MLLRWYCVAGDDVPSRLVGSKAMAVVTARTVSALAELANLCARV